ncbi:MAG: hypothetical protein AAF639_15530 [Chloroflexota bacterium]
MFRTTIQSKDMDSIDLYEVSLTKFRRGKYQSRSLKKQKEAHELAESIWELREKFPKTLGIKDPILCRMVTDIEDGCFLVDEEHYMDDDTIQDMLAESDTRLEIIDGHCRLEAISILAERDPAYNKIKVRIEYAEDSDAWLWGFIANQKRTDLDPIEEAISFSMALEDKSAGYTQQTLCQKAGITRSYLTDRLVLLKLPQDAQAMIADGIIPMSHSEQINRLSKLPTGMDDAVALIQKAITETGSAPTKAVLKRMIDEYVQALPSISELDTPWPLDWTPEELPEAQQVTSCEICPLAVKISGNGTRCTDPLCYDSRHDAWIVRQRTLQADVNPQGNPSDDNREIVRQRTIQTGNDSHGSPSGNDAENVRQRTIQAGNDSHGNPSGDNRDNVRQRTIHADANPHGNPSDDNHGNVRQRTIQTGNDSQGNPSGGNRENVRQRTIQTNSDSQGNPSDDNHGIVRQRTIQTGNDSQGNPSDDNRENVRQRTIQAGNGLQGNRSGNSAENVRQRTIDGVDPSQSLVELVSAWLEKEEPALSRRYTLARSLKEATSAQPQWNLLKAYCETNDPDCHFDQYVLSALQMVVNTVAGLLDSSQRDTEKTPPNDKASSVVPIRSQDEVQPSRDIGNDRFYLVTPDGMKIQTMVEILMDGLLATKELSKQEEDTKNIQAVLNQLAMVGARQSHELCPLP